MPEEKKQKLKEYQKEYREAQKSKNNNNMPDEKKQKSKEYQKEYQKEYREACKQKLKEYQKEY